MTVDNAAEPSTAVEDFQRMLERQRLVSEFMYVGDPGPWMELWSHKEPLSLCGARGPCKTGWEELSRTFHWMGARFSNGRDSRFDVEVAEVVGDMAYSVGYESAQVSVDAGPVSPWRLRVTHIYRRENGEWKLVHRHADIPQ
jgi:hypothetical protein